MKCHRKDKSDGYPKLVSYNLYCDYVPTTGEDMKVFVLSGENMDGIQIFQLFQSKKSADEIIKSTYADRDDLEFSVYSMGVKP